MSLDFYLEEMRPTQVFCDNVTHNLAGMAQEAGLYEVLWRPDENAFKLAGDAIMTLERGLALLKAEPERFKAMNPENGWGTYEELVNCVARVLEACIEYPNARIRVWA
jgi:hypothetical protein